jgi:hypothetical protein
MEDGSGHLGIIVVDFFKQRKYQRPIRELIELLRYLKGQQKQSKVWTDRTVSNWPATGARGAIPK